MKVKEEVHKRHWDFPKSTFTREELGIPPIDLSIEQDLIWEFNIDTEGYYSENNSWDPHTTLRIYREREETEQEKAERLEALQARKDQYTKRVQHSKEELLREFLEKSEDFDTMESMTDAQADLLSRILTKSLQRHAPQAYLQDREDLES